MSAYEAEGNPNAVYQHPQQPYPHQQPLQQPLQQTPPKRGNRGNYRCSRCGEPKKGHVCTRDTPDQDAKEQELKPTGVCAAVQVELDETMTVRLLKQWWGQERRDENEAKHRLSMMQNHTAGHPPLQHMQQQAYQDYQNPTQQQQQPLMQPPQQALPEEPSAPSPAVDPVPAPTGEVVEGEDEGTNAKI